MHVLFEIVLQRSRSVIAEIGTWKWAKNCSWCGGAIFIDIHVPKPTKHMRISAIKRWTPDDGLQHIDAPHPETCRSSSSSAYERCRWGRSSSSFCSIGVVSSSSTGILLLELNTKCKSFFFQDPKITNNLPTTMGCAPIRLFKHTELFSLYLFFNISPYRTERREFINFILKQLMFCWSRSFLNFFVLLQWWRILSFNNFHLLQIAEV